MNNDTLRHVDTLRQRADVSYEEAIQILERNNGDLMESLIELERQGRLHNQATAGSQPHYSWHDENSHANQAKDKANTFIKDAMKTRLVIKKKGENGQKDTVVNLSAPVVAGITLFAPYITLASAAVTLATGCEVKFTKDGQENQDQE